MNPSKAYDREQSEMLAQAFEIQIRRGQSVTAAIVAELAGCVVPDLTGGPAQRTTEQVAADSGLHLVDLEGGAVLLINGRCWR